MIKKDTLRNYRDISNEILSPIVREGKLPVLISAPHHVCQIKEGNPKESDDFTGDIAAILSSLLDCHLIVNVCGICDPNSDSEKESIYKKKSSAYISEHDIRLFIDIHGMADKNNKGQERPDLCIGTGKGGNISEKLKLVLERYKCDSDFQCKMDSPFSASRENTMSKYVHDKFKIDSLQIEIASKYRKIDDKTVRLVSTLKNYIEHVYEGLIQE